nr:MAG TPA: hypothetical protein [Bacteriophage sp.]DAT25798.1 MAG TPA: hypothetical protein [Caudoviricetes sp.]DAZ73997.1 MAG TPA: hypothetical protein [Caudoviricetes sp.]
MTVLYYIEQWTGRVINCRAELHFLLNFHTHPLLYSI